MKTIIVATDLSEAAHNAVLYAAGLAGSLNAGMVLFHVSEITTTFADVSAAANLDIVITDGETELNKLKDELAVLFPGLNIMTKTASGLFQTELDQFASSIIPYMIVIGSKGKTFSERIAFGTHATRLMLHSKWPVLAIPPSKKYTGITHVALACDFRKVIDERILYELKDLLKNVNGTLHVVNVNKDDTFPKDIVFASKMLGEAMSPLTPQFHFLKGKDKDRTLLEFCEASEIDLLIVLPRSHSFIDEIFHRSYTRLMVLHSSVPVMALHE